MKKVFYSAIIFLLLCGCSAQAKGDGSSSDPLVAKISIEDENVEPGEKVRFTLTVSKGEENVKKLDEAYYELVSVDEKNKVEKEDFEPNKNGEYSFVKEFEKGEQFFEETTTLLVGSEVSTEESHDHTEVTTSDTHEHETTNETQEGEKQKGNISTHLMYDSNAKKLLVHVSEGSAYLKEARVRFEIWNEKTAEKHTFLDTVEEKEGEYVHQLDSDYDGLYHVNIHVEKGETHYHKEEEVNF